VAAREKENAHRAGTHPSPIGLETLLDRAWHRPTTKDRMDALASVPLFAQLTKRHLRRIAGAATVAEYAAGDVIVQAGDEGDAFFLILSGRAKVTGPPRRAGLGRGDYFGEIALIDGEPRSATITATTELHAMKLPRRVFRKILEQEPPVAVALLTQLATRVRRLEKRQTA
jgi:CRP-like cAMP-binding protein